MVRMRLLNIFFYNFTVRFSLVQISILSVQSMAALKCLPAHSFNAHIILIIRECVYKHFPLFISLDHLLGKILALLSCVLCFIVFVSLSHMVFQVICGTGLYLLLIFAFLLTLIIRVVVSLLCVSPKSIHTHLFNAFIIPIPRDGV